MEHEIPQVNGTIKIRQFFCSKCGAISEPTDRWVCDDIFTRVESKVFPTSKEMRTWNDVMTKLARLFCLNKLELQAGFEPGDQILEQNDDYVLLRDNEGLLLIVLHDDESANKLNKVMQIHDDISGKEKVIANIVTRVIQETLHKMQEDRSRP